MLSNVCCRCCLAICHNAKQRVL